MVELVRWEMTFLGYRAAKVVAATTMPEAKLAQSPTCEKIARGDRLGMYSQNAERVLRWACFQRRNIVPLFVQRHGVEQFKLSSVQDVVDAILASPALYAVPLMFSYLTIVVSVAFEWSNTRIKVDMALSQVLVCRRRTKVRLDSNNPRIHSPREYETF